MRLLAGPELLPQASAPAEPARRWRVLVVDDSRLQRRILSLSLARWGYEVAEADSGADALRICAETPVDFVLSDWMMPGMSGLEFCRAFRAQSRGTYGYFILLTSKSEKGEIAQGLDAGADDFLTKPVDADELRARLTAGERILHMERELQDKNRLVTSTLQELQSVYDSLDRDLIEARKLQQTLVRERHQTFGKSTASILLRQSGHVGGDLVGWFVINPRRLALYSIDVCGHGVASAMMTARLAGLLSGASPGDGTTLTFGSANLHQTWPPEMIAHRLNRMMLEDMQVDQYFTMVYAEVDTVSGKIILVQAGHPHPAILRADARVDFLGDGGLPVGLIGGATYQRVDAQMLPGDRLFLMSDGITECPDATGTELGQDGLTEMLQRNISLTGTAFLEAMVWELQDFMGGADFPDDVSGVLFEYAAPGADHA